MDHSKYISPVISILSLAVALENYVEVGFFWKLLAVAISAIPLLFQVAVWLADRVKPQSPKGVEKAILPSSWQRYIRPPMILAGICAVFGIFALLVVFFYAINLKEISSTKDKCEFLISAGFQNVDTVSIPMPARAKAQCEPFDPSQDGARLADALMVDWDSANPQLQLSNFSSPQRIGLRCTPCIDIESIKIRVDPPTTKWLSPASRCSYIIWIFVIGGVLWIAAFILFWVRSR